MPDLTEAPFDKSADNGVAITRLRERLHAKDNRIGELERQLEAITDERNDAYVILANTGAELGAAEDTRWAFLPEMARMARDRIIELESANKLIGVALREYNSIALEATGTVPNMERGDGTTGYVDWQGVWEQVAELRPQLDAANKRIAELERDTEDAKVVLGRMHAHIDELTAQKLEIAGELIELRERRRGDHA